MDMLDREQFRLTYAEYCITVAPEQQRIFGLIFPFARWIVLPVSDTPDTFLVDSGGFGGVAFMMRIDYATNQCYLEPEESGAEWPLIGTLTKKMEPTSRPA